MASRCVGPAESSSGSDSESLSLVRGNLQNVSAISALSPGHSGGTHCSDRDLSRQIRPRLGCTALDRTPELHARASQALALCCLLEWNFAYCGVDHSVLALPEQQAAIGKIDVLYTWRKDGGKPGQRTKPISMSADQRQRFELIDIDSCSAQPLHSLAQPLVGQTGGPSYVSARRSLSRTSATRAENSR